MAGVEPNEITIKNYTSGISEILELLHTADFVAVDCTVETTGFLKKDETLNPVYLSDLSWDGGWYDQIKSREKTHRSLEVGIAVFKRTPDDPGRFQVEAFNIPVLPACIDDNELSQYRGRRSGRLQIDRYGKEFMEDVNLDLNKIFYFAAPYLNKEMLQKADEYMENYPDFMWYRRRRPHNYELLPDRDLDRTNAGKPERDIVLDRLKGVSKVFEGISERKLPVVGHNLLLKLIFIYKDFFQYLPDTFPEFVDVLSTIFGVVYDTKQIGDLIGQDDTSALNGQVKGSNSLYEMLRIFNSGSDTHKGHQLDVGDRSKHYFEEMLYTFDGILVEEDKQGFGYLAGFDAFCAGVLFLKQVFLPNSESEGFPIVDHLRKFQNKIFQAPMIPDRESTEYQDMIKRKKEAIENLAEEKARESEMSCKKFIDTKDLEPVRKWIPGLPIAR